MTVTIFTGILAAVEPNVTNFRNFFGTLTMNLFGLVILLISKKFKKTLSYLLPINLLIKLIVMNAGTPDYDLDFWNSKKHF